MKDKKVRIDWDIEDYVSDKQSIDMSFSSRSSS